MRPRPPPVTMLALAFLAGCAVATVFASPLSQVRSLSTRALLILPFLRPSLGGRIPVAVVMAILAGAVVTHDRCQTAEGDCRLHLPDGASGAVVRWFEIVPGPGARPFRLVAGLGCHGEVRVLWRVPASTGADGSSGRAGAFRAAPGQPVVALARWQRSPHP